MQHLEEGTIHAWLDGALPADEAAAVDAHARSCAECAAAVAEARGMIAGAARIVSALDIARGGVVPSAPSISPPRPASGASLWRRLRLTPSRAALAATILVAVAGTLVVRHQRPLGDAIDKGRRIDSSILMPMVAPVRRDSTAVAPPAEHRTPINHSSIAQPQRKAAASNGRLPSPAPTPVAPAPTPAASAAVVSGAAASTSGSALPTSAAANLDTAVRPFAKSTERADFAATARISARAVPRNALESAVEASVPGIVGCYQLTSQPTDTTFGALPTRFALERSGANPPQNVVRSVSPDGRIDSVVAGTSWRQAAPNQVHIVFVNSGVVNRTVELELAQAVATSRTQRGASVTLPIRRLDCVR